VITSRRDLIELTEEVAVASKEGLKIRESIVVHMMSSFFERGQKDCASFREPNLHWEALWEDSREGTEIVLGSQQLPVSESLLKKKFASSMRGEAGGEGGAVVFPDGRVIKVRARSTPRRFCPHPSVPNLLLLVLLRALRKERGGE
jgi:hypothetical protein